MRPIGHDIKLVVDDQIAPAGFDYCHDYKHDKSLSPLVPGHVDQIALFKVSLT